jgi:hypothetical protein
MKRCLRSLEVQVPEHLRRGTRPERTYQGRCYQRALNFILDHAEAKGCRLVHGTACSDLRGHAWVELSDGIVFDGVAQRFYRRHGYYIALTARKKQSFTPEQASRLAVAHNHCGPWTDEELRILKLKPGKTTKRKEK